MFFKIR